MTEQHTDNTSSPLSERELEILRLVSTGATNQQIAVQLDITLNTVKTHMRNIFSKTGASSRTEALLYAVRAGLVPVDSAQQEAATEEPPPAKPQPPTLPAPRPPEPPPTPVAPAAAPATAPPPEPPPPTPTSAPAPAAVPPHKAAPAPTAAPRLPLTWVMGGLLLVLLVGGAIWATLAFSQNTPDAAEDAVQEPASSDAPDDAGANERVWVAQAAMQVARASFGAASYDGKIHTIGGSTPDGVTDSVERYDPQSDTWTSLADLPTPAANMQAVVIGGKIYVAGGSLASGAVSDQVERYDPVQDRWSSIPPLPAPRSRYAAAALDGKLYLFGGWDGDTYCDTVWMYDPDERLWEERTPMPDARAGLSATVQGNTIHLLGGENQQGVLALHQAYNPVQDQAGGQPWSGLPPLPRAIVQPASVAVLSNIYTFDPASGNLFIYKTDTETWEVFQTDLPAESASIAALLVGSNLHVLGLRNAPPESFHIQYQVLDSIQLPLVPR